MTSRVLSNILYVEDDLDIQTVAQIALEVIGGFNLQTCSSGQQAMDAAHSGFAADLILLDVMMPKMDGPSTLAKLREIPQTSTTPVIFMTAKVQAGEVAYYKSLGALGVIAKPFDPMTLSDQVLSLWAKQDAGK